MSQSWGNLLTPSQTEYAIEWRNQDLPAERSVTWLPVGGRRSYGDSCINDGGIVLDTDNLSKFISFDAEKGVLCCESGVTLWEIASLVVPLGWFLPVTPGTSFVTLGGAIANDVHGKNHHRVGSFGCFVRQFELRRSSGDTLVCSAQSNAEYFNATIGGCGLTGLITWAEISLKRVSSQQVEVDSDSYGSLEDFLTLSEQCEHTHEYAVSWIDCLATGDKTGQGVFFKANHSDTANDLSVPLNRASKQVPALIGKGMPLINGLSLRAFNALYQRKNHGSKSYLDNMVNYFYPLDALLDWNRLYGRNGFFQFQCVLPFANTSLLIEILNRISQSGQGSFLSVLKTMGNTESPGLISFPRSGVTLALDFPNKGACTAKLLSELEAVVVEGQGAIYPAKDATMRAASFRQFFPAWEEFSALVDPAFSSSFWRRVTQS